MRGDSPGRFLSCLVILMAASLTACTAPERTAPASPTAAASSGPLRPFPPTHAFVDCVPYARAVSGLALHGDAWTWWNQAAGRYARGPEPRVGAVLAWQRTATLASGHVAVVVEIQGPRQILVSHANWGRDGDTRGKLHLRQPVIDVSPGNDWSEVRLMNTQGSFGQVYPTHGFIYQPADERRAENPPPG